MRDFHIASQIRFGAAPYFVFCDHASNAMPAGLNCLGIPEDILQTHIAWDIGAGALAQEVAENLNGVFFRCGFSRLIIDPNRDIHAQDSIPAVSDQIPIPGNQMLSDSSHRQRIERFFDPYHNKLAAALDSFAEENGAPFVVAVHSFTNRLMGAAEDRPWHVGLLWREDEESARRTMQNLRRRSDWKIGDNQPYDARVFNYSVDRHISPKRFPHITLEVRQDMICDNQAVKATAAILSEAIRGAAAGKVNMEGSL